jgi:arylsulfatase A-like enzyme
VGRVDTSVPFGPVAYPLNKRYNTPNLERLASQGMKFTNAYATPKGTHLLKSAEAAEE